MNNDKNRLDKLFKEKLQSKKFEANDADWNSMEDLLNKRRRTGFLGWLNNNKYVLVVGLLALFTAATIFVITGDEKNEIAQAENVTAEKTRIIKNENVENSTHNSSAEKENQVSDISSVISGDREVEESSTTKSVVELNHSQKDVKRSTESTANVNSPSQPPSAKVIDNTNSVTKKKTTNELEKPFASSNQRISNEEEMAKDNSTEKNAVQNQFKNELESDDDNVVESSNNSVQGTNDFEAANAEKESDKDISKGQSVSNSPEIKQESADKAVFTESVGDVVVQDTSKKAVTSIPSESATENNIVPNNAEVNSSSGNRIAQESNPVVDQNKSSAEPIIEAKPIIPDTTVEIYRDDSLMQKKSNRKIYLGLNASSAFVSKKLDATHPLSNEYLNRRENEESNTVDFHGGLSATVQFNQLMVSTGFDYSTYSEKVEYEPTSKFIIIDSTYVLDSMPSGGGNNFDTIWSVSINTIDSLNYSISSKNRKTKWTYVEIPLMVWYRMEKNKVLIDGGVGGSYGILQKVDADYLNTELTNLENVDAESNYKDLVFNAMLATRVHYKIDENWLIGLDFRYKQNISSIFKSDYPVEQKYSSFNTGLSIMYLIKSK
ncbi:MAG: outer membrane beta-barrel protein [Bacteroidia bacterium]|nr:outer membrane beta-barrel protein [Bacteroidia bacterium]